MNDRFQVCHRTGDGTVGRTATAGAHELACGATITSSTKLRADLTNCPGDGLVVGADNITLVAGDANTVKANAVDGAKGGCEGCFGYGIGVLSGTGNVVNANLVSRSAADGINAAAGTWVGLNVAAQRRAGDQRRRLDRRRGQPRRSERQRRAVRGRHLPELRASARRAPGRSNASAISS